MTSSLTSKKRVIAMAEERKEFVTLEDGYVYYWPEGSPHGAFPAVALRLLADELDRRNAEWDKQVQSDPAIAAPIKKGYASRYRK